MENCLFCKIINGDIPCFKIYEDDYTLAFLSIAKDYVGHTLVVPKVHSENILDADKEMLFHVMETVQKISNHYVKNCGYDGINTFNNNNKSGEQEIMHFHVHIIPRKENDNFTLFLERTMEMDLEEIHKQLKL